MKDFAKSVRTGNAYSRGQKIGTDGKYEYVINDVMQDGTILVSRHPDGRTFTFSSEQEVKDWLRNSKIGNATLGPNWDKKRQLEDELRGWMTMVNKLEGEEKRNAEKQISDIRKELNDVKIKIAHGENKKVGNEYKPDVTKTPAEYERLIKQAKRKEELSDLLDDIEYDLKEYEIAIDYCNEQIKQHQRMISTLRMVQRNAKDALNKI